LTDETSQLPSPTKAVAPLNYRSSKTDQPITPLFSPRTRRRIAIVLSLLFCWSAYWVWSRTIAQNGSRIDREHGLVLPASAANFVCEGDAWGITDRSAISSFTMNAADVPTFIAQLKPGGPGSSPWATGSWGGINSKGVAQYDCLSPTGDFLTVGIQPLGSTQVVVHLYTDWN
jgi:hypothetical protein